MTQGAYLLLEDGRRFDGRSFGGSSHFAPGEVVFNTCMTGYQEVLTDPSYTGQLVVMTYPLIGNYGVNDEDPESAQPAVAGFIVREASRLFSNWRARGGLADYLNAHDIAGLADVDTRALTRHLRSRGAMRGAIVTDSVPEARALERVLEHPRMEGRDLACGVSTDAAYEFPAEGIERYRVVALDFGMKANSARLLAARGCRVTVVPSSTTAPEIIELDPDGIFISNGPGDPAALEQAEELTRKVVRRGTPTLGICLGHQLICRAFGASTYKLPFGHHGGNHPVRNLARGQVEITSQNHGFAVRRDEGDGIPGAPALRLTHVNLYDDTVEGVAHRELPLVSVQYHPEAAPGPHDSSYLFDDFVEMMGHNRAR